MLASVATPSAPSERARRPAPRPASPRESTRPSGCGPDIFLASRHSVGDPCSLGADRCAPEHIGPGQRQHGHIDASVVHRTQPRVVVEHFRHQRHEWRTGEVNGRLSGARLLQLVAAAVLLQQVEPRARDHMGVDVDDGHAAKPELRSEHPPIRTRDGPRRPAAAPRTGSSRHRGSSEIFSGTTPDRRCRCARFARRGARQRSRARAQTQHPRP